MPNSPSAKKRQRQNVTRRERNRSIKSALKTQVRKVREEVAAGHTEEAQSEFRLAAKRADQAAAKGVIHGNVASRIKSRLSHAIKLAAKPAKK
jgi:small subunit ribosomal protein S20